MPKAYYSEWDPYCAEYLRNLIAAGLIAPGYVDDRSIADVQPSDLNGFDQCHFFAGLGGWSYALRLAGWDDARPVWTGSCPCQPFSAAGAGKASGDERHLWPIWFELIRAVRPAVLFGEQVEAAIGWGWLDLVHTDLEAAGYAVGAAVLPACGVGAPHIRQRLWFVGNAAIGWDGEQPCSARSESPTGKVEARADIRKPSRGASSNGELGDTQRSGARRDTGTGISAEAEGEGAGQVHGAGRERTRSSSADGELADTERAERGPLDSTHGDEGLDGLPQRQESSSGSRSGGEDDKLAFSAGDGWIEGRSQRDGDDAAPRERRQGELSGRLSEPSILGNTTSAGLERQRRSHKRSGRHTPDEPPTRGMERHWSDLIWLPCTDGKQRPTQSGIFPLAHGIPARVAKLRALGNAIVPQVAAEFIRASDEAMRAA